MAYRMAIFKIRNPEIPAEFFKIRKFRIFRENPEIPDFVKIPDFLSKLALQLSLPS